VDLREVVFAADEEEHGEHGLEARIAARLAYGGLKEPVQSFEQAIGLAYLGSGDDAVMATTA
jgi:hypothetical protein